MDIKASNKMPLHSSGLFFLRPSALPATKPLAFDAAIHFVRSSKYFAYEK
jgi:hypothetical protein